MVWFSPRRKGSIWSAINKAHLVELEARGELQPSGVAVIERAKADGSWSILDSVEALEKPADLQAALDDDPVAAAGWEAQTKGRKKEHLWALKSAKRPATRSKRLAKAVAVAREKGAG